MSLLSHKTAATASPRKTREKLILKTFKFRVFRGLCLLLFAFPAHAERKYFLGTTLDVLAGAGNQIGTSSFNLESIKAGFTPYYSAYPSISLKSVGKHSDLDLDYTFAGEYYQMNPGFTSTWHATTGSFNAQLGNRTHLKISDTFSTMPQYSAIAVLKGSTITPEGQQYVFEPQIYQRSSISDSGNIGVDVDVTPKSFLTFAASGSFRQYDETVNQTNFSNQMRVEGSLSFSHKHSTQTTWNLKYRVWQNDYQDNFPTARAHSATIGLSRVLSPGLKLTLEARTVICRARL